MKSLPWWSGDSGSTPQRREHGEVPGARPLLPWLPRMRWGAAREAQRTRAGLDRTGV